MEKKSQTVTRKHCCKNSRKNVSLIMPREENILSAEEKIVETVFPLHFKKSSKKFQAGGTACVSFFIFQNQNSNLISR